MKKFLVVFIRWNVTYCKYVLEKIIISSNEVGLKYTEKQTDDILEYIKKRYISPTIINIVELEE